MPLTAGTRLGPYEILAPLGAGGMGEVYRATDTRLHRTIAIKILPSAKVADADRKERFLQEARAASALSHPNIVTLHDIANDSGIDYLVMEFVPGKSLDKLIGPKGLPLAEALGYAQQLAEALAAAHDAGIIHRDMKPANVMVTAGGQVKILDFGLAKLVERAAGVNGQTQTETLGATLTEAGTILGTVAYMSPEQARGTPLDSRSDIYSLGVVLYEMLSGVRPFRGKSTIETLHAIMTDPPPPIAQPPELREIVDKALAKDVSDRYRHAGDLALDLRRFQKAWETKSLLSMRANPAVPTLARQRGLWIAVAAAVTVSAVLGWLLHGPRMRVENPLANAQFTRVTDFEGSEFDAGISRDGKFVVFRSDRAGPVDTWVSQIGSGHFVNLTNGTRSTVLVRNAGFTPDGSEIWLAALINGDRARIMPSMGGTPRPLWSERTVHNAWSPDGSQLVYHEYTPGDPTFVADRTGSNPRKILVAKAGTHNHYHVWSADAKWIYFISGFWDAREMDLWRIRPSGGDPERLTYQSSDMRYLAPLDDRTILYTSPDQNGAGPWLWAFDTERKAGRRISSGLEVYTSVDASADGRRLSVTVANPTANLWSFPLLGRTVEEKEVQPYNMSSVRAYAPRFGGTSLFYLSSHGGGDGLWRYDNKQTLEVWRGADGALLEPAGVSLDGRQAAIILRKQGKRTLHVLLSDGGNVRPLAPAIDVTGAASWSPDGKWLVAGGNDAQGPGLFKIPLEGGEPLRLATGTATNPVWSPDGSVIIYTGPVVGPSGPLLTIRPGGAPLDLPEIRVRAGTEHYRFVPGRRELVYVPYSQVGKENFWLLDLDLRQTRQLANFDCRANRTFDITPDGKQIVFDRLRDNSDIVLIDLPGKPH